MKEIRSEIVHVTPEMAREWLARIGRQRPRNKAHVIALAADISGGRWETNNDAVSFDENGHLINGQHRMEARSSRDLHAEAVTGLRRAEASAARNLRERDEARQAVADLLAAHMSPSDAVRAEGVRVAMERVEGWGL